MENESLDANKIRQLLLDAKNKKEEEIKDLKSRSKQLYELVTIEHFTVDDVVAESHATSFTPDSERMIGGESPVYHGGFTSRIVLKVSPENKVIPVRTLNFDGFSAVRTGDYITAQIPRYREERDYSKFNYDLYEIGRPFYVEREFSPEEIAIELALLSVDGKVLRRDRAVNYSRFVKQ